MEAICQGWTRHDLKGTGDCAYRAICGARRYAKTGEHHDTNAATAEAAELRAQCVTHCKKPCGQIPNFLCARQKKKTRINATANQQLRPSRVDWTPGWSQNIGALLFLASHSRAHWNAHCCLQKTGGFWPMDTNPFCLQIQPGKACAARQEHPIVVVLEKHHYTYLTPPSEGKIPPTWLAGESNPDCAVIDFTGDGESTGTASVHTMLFDNLSRTNKASRSIAAALATA